MKYAILADIHANLAALHAVRADLQAEGCSRVVCLGDIVGGGPDPAECVEVIRSLDALTVQGNRDEHAVANEDPPGADESGRRDRARTRSSLSAAQRQWLGALPYRAEAAGFEIVHASLPHPERWEYVVDQAGAAAHFAWQKATVCFYGHVHHPLAFILSPRVRGGFYSTMRVEPGKKYLVNPGSVGEPRDGDPRASYAIYDLAERTIQLRRVAYDVAAQQRKRAELGSLPPGPSAGC